MRKVMAAAILSAGILILVLVSDAGGCRDFIAYWAAGKLLVHGGNPYDPAAVLALEKAAGLAGDTPLLMRNLPFALTMAAPLGYLSSKGALIVWSIAMVAALMISVRTIQAIYGEARDTVRLFAYTFPPVLACLMAGQTGMFLLLGMVLFLRWHDSRPFLSGMCLVLCATKPHLFLSFGLALLAWSVSRREWRIPAGLATGIAATLAIPVLADAHVLAQYFGMARNLAVETEFIPTVGGFLRVLLNRRAVWLQFLPAAVAAVWTGWYFYRARRIWNWRGKEGALVMLVSILTAPYAWFTDEVLVLPAVMLAVYMADRSGRSLRWLIATGSIALIEVFAGVALTSGAYGWTAAAWLACCAPLLSHGPFRGPRHALVELVHEPDRPPTAETHDHPRTARDRQAVR